MLIPGALSSPILQRLARGEDIPPMRTAEITAGLEVLDIVVQNLQGADHPFHLHDYNFWVLSSGNGTITPESVPLCFPSLIVGTSTDSAFYLLP